MTADHGDRFAHLGAFGLVKVGGIDFDPGDQVPDPADLL